MIKVSIIVAVYNAELYLDRCINSLLEQTLHDIEIICVNDCSTDGSKSILKQYNKKDSRLQLLDMPINSGAAAARNRGIDSARGKYILIVDADDYLENIALENLYYKAEENQVDMCFFKPCIHNHTNEEVPLGIVNQYEGVYCGKRLLSIFCEMNEFFLYPWSVIFRRDFLNNSGLRYKSIKIGEGGEMNSRAIYFAERVVVDDGHYYHYYVNNQSITHRNDSKVQLLIGQIYQYIGMLKLFVNDEYSEELHRYLDGARKKFVGGIKNLSNAQKEIIEKKLEDEFSKHIFNTFFIDNLYIKDFTEKELQIIQEAKSIMLYGAGNATADVINLLNKHEIEIKGFIVSDKTKNRKVLFGHHVYEITEICNFEKNTLIIITANKRYQETIKMQLMELGFNNLLFLNIQI